MDQQNRYPGADADGFRASNEFHIDGNVGAIATGQHGQATGNVYVSAGGGDPLEMIDRLLRKLEADAGTLDGEQAEDVLDDAKRLHTEVHSRRPSAEGIRALLTRLTTATGSTATLLATVEQIKELVSAILH
ncbi:MAG: hypothetical protein JO345_00395 [Streptosporangiaceae bacterium]|nr:hypothetical protein [Streptosporangiaceae bacterium]